MSSRPILVLTLLGTAVLAGCVGGGAGGGKSNPTFSSFQPDASTGVINGAVTDSEARPLADVQVGIRSTQEATRTDASGRFSFGNLDPGKYTVDAAKIGFDPIAREVEVKAGETTLLDLQLAPLAITGAPHFVAFPFQGYYDCALGAAAWVSACSYPYTAAYLAVKNGTCVQAPACTPPITDLHNVGAPKDLQKNEFRYNFTVQGNATVVSEMSWTPTSAAATRMQLVLSCANYDPVWDDCSDANDYATATGASPLRVQWDTAGKTMVPKGWVMARGYLPFSDLPPLGNGQDANLQVALNQKFEMWNSVWYNGKPPNGWSIYTSGTAPSS